MATLRDIAIRAGVSVATASRALSHHEHVREETRARVQAVARELGYRPNALARGLRRNQTRTVGLLVPDILNSSYSGAAAALVQSQLHDFGYGLVLHVSKNDSETERRCIDNFRAQQVDGLLHVPCTSVGAHVLREGRHPIPVVEFFRRSGAGDFDAVVYDEDVGAHDVVQHLVGLGHRRIGVIAGPRRLGSTGRRLTGARRAVEEAGLSPRVLSVLHGEYTSETGRRAFQNLVDHHTPPTAVFATSRQFVLGAALAAKERGIVIPDQLSLAGFGDPEWSQLVTPALTTYTLPLHEMVMTAAQLLISRIEDDQTPPRSRGTQIVVSGNLAIRNSTAPPMSDPTGSDPSP